MHQQPFNQLTNKGIFCEGLKRPICLTNRGIVYWCRWWFRSIWNRSESKLNIKHHWQIKGPNSLAAKPPPIGIVLSTVYVSTSPSGIVSCPSIVTAMPLRQRLGRTGTVHGYCVHKWHCHSRCGQEMSLKHHKKWTHTKYRNKLKGTKVLGSLARDTEWYADILLESSPTKVWHEAKDLVWLRTNLPLRKTNGWNLKITPMKRGSSSKPPFLGVFSVGGVPWLGNIILMTQAPSPRMVKSTGCHMISCEDPPKNAQQWKGNPSELPYICILWLSPNGVSIKMIPPILHSISTTETDLWMTFVFRSWPDRQKALQRMPWRRVWSRAKNRSWLFWNETDLSS